MSKQSKDASKVAPLVGGSTRFIPPNGWAVKGEAGFQRGKDAAGQAVNLVRLIDLVSWLEGRSEIPRADALDKLSGALPDGPMCWLYRLDAAGGWASLVDPGYSFGLPTPETLRLAVEDAEKAVEKARMNARWNDGAPLLRLRALDDRRMQQSRLKSAKAEAARVAQQNPVEPGLPALKRLLHDTVVRRGAIDGHLALLAIPHALAHEWIGWGCVVAEHGLATERAAPTAESAPEGSKPTGPTWSEVVSIKKDNKNAHLSHAHKKAAAAEFAKRCAVSSASGVAIEMAAELGISVTAFNKTKRPDVGKREKQNEQRAA